MHKWENVHILSIYKCEKYLNKLEKDLYEWEFSAEINIPKTLIREGVKFLCVIYR